MKRYIKLALSSAIVAALIVGGIKAVKKAQAQDASAPLAKVYPITVQTFEPHIQQVTLSLPYLAEVANDKDVKLSTRIASRVLRIKPSGSSVKKGDLIATLDTTNIQTNLKSVQEQIKAVQVALNNLRQTHKRTLDLLHIKGASIEQSQKESTLIAQAESKLSALKQKEITLKNNLSYATIISPVDGVISKTFVNQGALSSPGHPLVAISSNNGFYLMVRVPSNLTVQAVKFGNNVYEASPLGSTFHGLAEYKVYVNHANLISGDRVEVDVVTFNQQGIQFPFNALLNRNGKSYVLVVSDNHAQALEVHILQSAQEGVVVSDNLEGKKLVVAQSDILLKLLSGYALSIKE